MTPTIELYIDIQSQPGRLVGGLTGSQPAPLAGLYQGSKLNLRVFPVRPTGKVTGGAAYEHVPIGQFADIKVALGTRAGTSTIYAQAGAGTTDTFVAQATSDTEGKQDYFAGTLNLNTTPLNSALASADYVEAYLEVHLSVGGSYRVVYQVKLLVYAAVIDPTGSSALPTAATEYYTAAELNALFVRWDNRTHSNNRGKTIILVSPDGGQNRELGVGDNGEPTDNIVAGEPV